MKKFMQKSKKLQNNKPKCILIFGPIGVGKLTVAQELQKIVDNYSLVHCHMILNLVEELFPRSDNTPDRSNLFMKIFETMVSEAALKGKNIIMTHPYSASFVYKNGIKDTTFVESVMKICEDNGGLGCPVHLICNIEENVKRASSEERRIYKKLTDETKLREIFNKEDLVTSPKLKNNLKIDTTKLSAKKIAEKIKKNFKL